MKTSQVTKYLFKKQLPLIGVVYLTLIVLIVVLPFILALVSGTLSSFSVVDQLRSGSVSAVFGLYIFVISTLSYENFKFLIQNGISRKTFFEAQLTVNGLLVLIGNTFNLLYGYLFLSPITNHASFNLYTGAYAQYFTNPIINVALNFVMSGLLLAVGSLLGMVIGNFLTLFSKVVQRLILIIGPIAAGVVILFIAKAMIDYRFRMSWVVNFAKLILGYQASGGYNPFPLMITLLLFGCVLALIVRVLFARKQLKRD
ncbi:ABC transporter permease [Lentilactobacillus fungorum]|jgi:hypothetical protein|uniref:ABC transporter permease n=1 Tax=Lentilactobacillus fungorum TaxID=2201250 RepID=A0ABQ3VZM7_9LACO|nr:ABC transporter permease [Lentilactobacillus fungorum]GHP14358.1 ABC transporter permease [Lentilactobacillus fungorum]